MKTTNKEKLSCMWAAADFRFRETDDEIEKAYWLGKTDAIDEALKILELEPPISSMAERMPDKRETRSSILP